MYIESVEKVMAKMNQMTVVDPAIKGLLPIFSGMEQKGVARGK